MDRAALDVALELGLVLGGWCPAGRAAEDGPIAPRYPLVETPSRDPGQRTVWNVRDGDATLVLSRKPPGGGTALAVEAARQLARPLLRVRLGQAPEDERQALSEARAWLHRHRVRALNVAGPRESEEPGIGSQAAAFLRALLRQDA